MFYKAKLIEHVHNSVGANKNVHSFCWSKTSPIAITIQHCMSPRPMSNSSKPIQGISLPCVLYTRWRYQNVYKTCAECMKACTVLVVNRVSISQKHKCCLFLPHQQHGEKLVKPAQTVWNLHSCHAKTAVLKESHTWFLQFETWMAKHRPSCYFKGYLVPKHIVTISFSASLLLHMSKAYM